jgi:DNA-binding NtrC family response regulator
MASLKGKPRILVTRHIVTQFPDIQTIIQSSNYKLIPSDWNDKTPSKTLKYNVDLILVNTEEIDTQNYHICQHLKADETLRYIPIIAVGEEGTTTMVSNYLDNGVDNYIMVPFQQEELLAQIRAMLRIRRQYVELHEKKKERLYLKYRANLPYALENFIGKSRAMQRVFDVIGTVAPTDSTVLIQGETGTGKELVARAIHLRSRRWERPFIAINCAALPETLLQSELFGHEKGAFTDAIRRKPGKFELAHTGTLFLDEVGELSPMTQLALLRVLQEHKFERVGGEQTIETDVRIVAATNKDLETAVAEKAFREDLYYRLSVVTIDLPPLRERKEDIPVLGMEFLQRNAKKMQKDVNGFSKKTLELMMRYDWPGNVRELENVIERAVVFAKGPLITEHDLPTKLHKLSTASASREPTLKEIERKLILKTLIQCNWNKHKAARELGIDRGTLYGKIKKYGLEKGVEKSTN